MDTALEFTNRLVTLLRAERHALADFLVALAEFDHRRLYRDRGHTSLFSFLRRELKLSAGAAQYRKTAAELSQRYPEVEGALREGKLCLSSVCELAKVVTTENCGDVLPRVFGLSSRDAAAVAVPIRPVENPPRREVIVPIRAGSAPAAVAPVHRRRFYFGRPKRLRRAGSPVIRIPLTVSPSTREPSRRASRPSLHRPPRPPGHLGRLARRGPGADAPHRLEGVPEGGTSTIDHLRLLCRGRNLEAARRVLGDAVMGAYAGERRAGSP